LAQDELFQAEFPPVILKQITMIFSKLLGRLYRLAELLMQSFANYLAKMPKAVEMVDQH